LPSGSTVDIGELDLPAIKFADRTSIDADATIETREQKRIRNIGALNLLMPPLPWTNAGGCVGTDVVGGRVDVIVIVDLTQSMLRRRILR